MTQMKCYDCDQVMEADDRAGMLDQMYAHYMGEHKEIITGADENEKKQWMERFEADWKIAAG